MTRTSMEFVMHQTEALRHRFVAMAPQLSSRVDFTKVADHIKRFAEENPMLMLLISVLSLFATIPIIFFICFVVATLGMTAMGFVFVEGTLLTVGTIFLAGILFALGCVALGFSAFIAAAWFFCNMAVGFINGLSNQLTAKRMRGGPREHDLQHVD